MGSPFSSKYGFQCLSPFAGIFLSFRFAVHVTMQCTHRWSNPIGTLLSRHTSATFAFESPKVKSSCTRVSSKYLWHVQVSFMSCGHAHLFAGSKFETHSAKPNLLNVHRGRSCDQHPTSPTSASHHQVAHLQCKR